MHTVSESLVSEICACASRRQRILIGIAGPPASGKSTLAEALLPVIDQRLGEGVSVILPMDGFHLDNALLEVMGARARKGAPHTFDVAGFAATLRRVAENDADVVIPVFDRKLDLARAGGRVILGQHRVIVIEGNYLLLDQPGWADLQAIFDFTAYLDVEETELNKRLVQRWIDHDHSPADAAIRASQNDLPNARLVASKRLSANRVLHGI